MQRCSSFGLSYGSTLSRLSSCTQRLREDLVLPTRQAQADAQRHKISTMVAPKRQQHGQSICTGGLLEDSDLLHPPTEGPLKDAVAQCLQTSDDPEREEERLRSLLAAFSSIKKGFPGSALQRAVVAQPDLLATADPFRVQELLSLLARSCLLPGRVVNMVASRPDILTQLSPEKLAAHIAHLKVETAPMGSQIACLWQKFPQSLWMTIPEVEVRLAWLRRLGVPNDRIRFVYAREPVFTAPLSSFQPQLEILQGLIGEGADQKVIGVLLAAKPQYLTMPVARMEKLREKIAAELKR